MDFCGCMTGAIGSWLLLLILEVKAMTAANFAEARESALLKWLAELGGVTSSERQKKIKNRDCWQKGDAADFSLVGYLWLSLSWIMWITLPRTPRIITNNQPDQNLQHPFLSQLFMPRYR